jgi:hypothetical protein
MTGLDLSEASLEQARRLAKDTGTDVGFHHAEVYRAAEVLGAGQFDLVYTGVGALCLTPDTGRRCRPDDVERNETQMP